MSDHRLRSTHFTSPISLLIILLTSLCTVGCSKKAETDPRLVRIAEMASSTPLEALDSLKTIDKSTLSEQNRHYYDFLTVKASDKGFIKHTSDSLILDVISYYENTNNPSLISEANYYGGRVYKDLGDYPSALNFFHKALEIVPQDEAHKLLLGNIYNQISGLYYRLRLFEDAEEYLTKAIAVDIECNDTLNLIYDLETLGNLKLNTEKYEDADNALQTALKLSEKKSGVWKLNILMHIAGLKHKTDSNMAALSYIRHIPDSLKTSAKYTALSYASEIYLAAGLLDTAFNYAHQLAFSNSRNRRNGFTVLLAPEMKAILSIDSLIKYTHDYKIAVEEYLNHNEAEEVAIRTSSYNYNNHLNKRLKAEERNSRLINFINLIMILVLCIIIILLWRENFYEKKKMQLQSALDHAKKLSNDKKITW